MTMISRVFIFIFMTYLSFLPINANAQVNKSWLDQQIQSYIKNRPVKGMIYGLWVDGKPISINAVGESMTSVPATKEMHFRIGGVTETMLTTLLMQMVEKNMLSLDDTIERWYPNLPNANKITLKMLANGTSGIRDYVYNDKFIELVINHPFKQWSDKDLLDFSVPPTFEPGTDQKYSHTDYVVLGDILMRVGKKPLNELFKEYILNKLGLANTAYDRTATIPSPVLHSFSQDRSVYEDATFWSPSWTSSSGATTSTIEDLGIWANAWMRGTLLNAKSNQQLRAPDTVGKGKNKNDLYFAMGFGVANHWLIQNPSFNGYSGIFAVLPEKNIVFIAFNTLNQSDKPTDENYSMTLWQQIAANLAPDYPPPAFGR